MCDVDQQKLISSMTMCRRAGRLVLGFDAVKEASEQGRLHCILLAQDCAAKTAKEIRFYCAHQPCRVLPFSMQDMMAYFTKRTAVFGVVDEGFAHTMLRCYGDDPRNMNAGNTAGNIDSNDD